MVVLLYLPYHPTQMIVASPHDVDWSMPLRYRRVELDGRSRGQVTANLSR